MFPRKRIRMIVAMLLLLGVVITVALHARASGDTPASAENAGQLTESPASEAAQPGSPVTDPSASDASINAPAADTGASLTDEEIQTSSRRPWRQQA